MSTWTTSLSDLRTLLNDNSNDSLRSQKKVFGNVDGANLHFKTFEFRRKTDFTSAASPLGVYVSGVLIATSNIQSDNIETGDFYLKIAVVPVKGTVVTASYYVQQFLDDELNGLILRAVQSLQLGNDPLQVNPALRDAVLNYAAAEGLKKLALKYTMRASDTFLLEDAPKKESLAISETYTNLAKTYMKDAFAIRDAFYTRAGQTLAPNFVNNFGRVSNVTPRR